jgi:hypothetical protein
MKRFPQTIGVSGRILIYRQQKAAHESTRRSDRTRRLLRNLLLHRRAYSSSLTLKPMDFVRSGGFAMSRLPLSPSQPRLAAALKNQQVRLR